MTTKPLATQLRPQSLSDLVGHRNITDESSIIGNIIEGKQNQSILLYGPPGTGKTTIAHIIKNARTHDAFIELSAVNASVKDVRHAIDQAEKNAEQDQKTFVFIDEIHRFSKTQQDSLLHAVESGVIILIAATTENPGITVIPALQSRMIIVELKPLNEQDLEVLIDKALKFSKNAVKLTDAARKTLIEISGGDARKLITAIEVINSTYTSAEKQKTIDSDLVYTIIPTALARYDRKGDQHYDLTSAFIKSIRGSDPNAAVYWLARLIDSGEDPRFIARRLVIHASEDIGLADPQALLIAQAAASAVATIGWPEARITLTQATLHLACAPKSNAVLVAINTALNDVKKNHRRGSVPAHLRDSHYSLAQKLGSGVGYKYPHDYPYSCVQQSYLPADMVDNPPTYYRPSAQPREQEIAQKLAAIEKFTKQSNLVSKNIKNRVQ